MKLFAYILSLYILLLIGIPCGDASGCNMLHESGIASPSTEHHHNDVDHCSPFCTCDCCACPAANPDNVNDFTIFSLFQKYNSEFSSAYISALFISIWQPPKLS